MTLVLLAQTPGTPTGPEFGKASPLGLVIVLLLLAGTFLLIWSMNRHIKGLPATFEPEHPEPDQEADEGTEHGITRRNEESKGADPEGRAESS
ncbi:hypothetical protein [Nocardia gipuzkoensis]|uniref:hypothetical protein n=1 Tax=Nocardia gipuzkoensis TaxID=2749991 RepID=UPI00237D41B1|nr:hypothetical protein [Nocardia gipuzkoensis]MDE1670684.1 hypothetical protein [Nocardia gipuzkoensis]